MKLLMLQFVDPRQVPPLPVFSQELGTLSSLLRAEGIDTALAPMAGYRAEILRAAVDRHRPTHVLVEMRSQCLSAAHRTITDVAGQYRLPVVVCGPYASCRPATAISTPGANALLLGEYDQSGLELLRAWREGEDGAGIAGVWLHTEGGLVKGPVRQLNAELDSLPQADRELFGYAQWPKAGGEAAFRVARGCPRWCGHCVNDWYMDMYADKGPYVRRRSATSVLEEVASVVGHYEGVGAVRFEDHCFAMDLPWLRQFAEGYPRRCALAYTCRVPLTGVSDELATLLAGNLCRGVTVHIASGSRFIREEIFAMNISDDQIVQTCHVLRRAGLHVRATVFVGSPYESQITVNQTICLLRRAEVDEVRPRVFYPIPGSRAADLCAENGWISGRGEENFWLQRSVLDMPSMPAGQIDAVAAKFDLLLRQSSHAGIQKAFDKVINGRKGLLGRLAAKGRFRLR